MAYLTSHSSPRRSSFAWLTKTATSRRTRHRTAASKRASKGRWRESQDLGSAAVLLGSVVGLMWLGPALVDYLAILTRQQLGGEPWMSADVSFTTAQWHSVTWGLAKVMLPILGVVMLLAIASNVLQVGLLVLARQVGPGSQPDRSAKGLRPPVFA